MTAIDKFGNAFDENNNIIVTGAEVLKMLRPQGGWSIVGNEYDSIQWKDCEPVTRKQFEDGFSQYINYVNQKITEENAKILAAEEKLAALNITKEDLKYLLS
jgi:hypothetical protein